jgi:hypothetical protein
MAVSKKTKRGGKKTGSYKRLTNKYMTVSKKIKKGGKPGSCKLLTNKYSCNQKKNNFFQNVCSWVDNKSICTNSISKLNKVKDMRGNWFDITSRDGSEIIINTVKKLINRDFDLKINESQSDLTYLQKLQKSKKTFNESSDAIDAEINRIIDNIVIHNKKAEYDEQCRSRMDCFAKERAVDRMNRIKHRSEYVEFYPGMEPLYETDIITNIYNLISKKFTNFQESNMFDKLFRQGEWRGTLVPSKAHRLLAVKGAMQKKSNCFTITTTKKLVDIFPLHGTEDPEFPEAIAKGKLRAQSVLNPNLWKIIEQHAHEYDGIPTITIEMMQKYPEFKFFQSAKPIEVVSSYVVVNKEDAKNVSYTLDGVGRVVNLKRGFLLCVDDEQHPLTKEILNTIEIEVYEYQFPEEDWKHTISYVHKLRAIDGVCDSPLYNNEKEKYLVTWNNVPCTSECRSGLGYNYCYKDSLQGWDYSDCCNAETEKLQYETLSESNPKPVLGRVGKQLKSKLQHWGAIN